METIKNSDLKDTFLGRDIVLSLHTQMKNLIFVLIVPFVLIILVWVSGSDLNTVVTMGVIFFLAPLGIIVAVLVGSKKTVVTNTTIASTYQFFSSRNTEKKLSDCTGYFSYYLFSTGGRGSKIQKYGVVMRFSDGTYMNFSCPKKGDRSSLDACIARLRANDIPQVFPNLGGNAQNWKNDDYAYPLIVGSTKVVRIAKKTFEDPTYNPVIVI